MMNSFLPKVISVKKLQNLNPTSGILEILKHQFNCKIEPIKISPIRNKIVSVKWSSISIRNFVKSLGLIAMIKSTVCADKIEKKKDGYMKYFIAYSKENQLI